MKFSVRLETVHGKRWVGVMPEVRLLGTALHDSLKCLLGMAARLARDTPAIVVCSGRKPTVTAVESQLHVCGWEVLGVYHRRWSARSDIVGLCFCPYEEALAELLTRHWFDRGVRWTVAVNGDSWPSWVRSTRLPLSRRAVESRSTFVLDIPDQDVMIGLYDRPGNEARRVLAEVARIAGVTAEVDDLDAR